MWRRCFARSCAGALMCGRAPAVRAQPLPRCRIVRRPDHTLTTSEVHGVISTYLSQHSSGMKEVAHPPDALKTACRQGAT